MGTDGRDGHHMAAALRLEVREDGSDAVQKAFDVDVEHAVPLVDQQRVEPRQQHHAGVADQDIKASVARHDGVDQTGNRGPVAHVDPRGNRGRAVC